MDVASWMNRAPVVTSPDETLRTALLKMQLEDLDSLPVVMSGFLVGMVTKASILESLHSVHVEALLDDPALTGNVICCMLPAPVVCRPTDSLASVGLMLSGLDLGQLPVVRPAHTQARVVERETVFAELIRVARVVELEDRLAA